jgi:hypothetical protein
VTALSDQRSLEEEAGRPANTRDHPELADQPEGPAGDKGEREVERAGLQGRHPGSDPVDGLGMLQDALA